MTDLSSVVCGTDLSQDADEAIAQAAALAAAHRARLTVVHASAFGYGGGGDADLAIYKPFIDRDQIKNQLAERLRAQVDRVAKTADAEIEVRIDETPPYASIVACADDRKADLVVVGSRGATGLKRMVLGSVAEGVVRHASCPVVVARPSPATGHVLAATDLSDPSFAAITAANAEARRRKAKLTVAHCMDFPPTMMALGFAPLAPLPPDAQGSRVARSDEAAARVRETLAKLGVAAEVVVAEGTARANIPEIAEQLPAELVVVGTRGRTGLKRLLLGSVAESIVRHVGCSVLAVRSHPA